MTEQSDENRAAEEQNKQVQEEARAKIEEENEKRLQAQRDAVGDTTTKPLDFASAAKETDALEQPPNFSNVQELEQPVSVTQPPAKNVTEETLPEDIRATPESGSPSVQAAEPKE